MKKIHVIGGGTISHVRNHLALCAPAFGKTATSLALQFRNTAPMYDTRLHLTVMAGGRNLVTNEDVSNLLDTLIADPDTRVIIMNAALTDFNGQVGDVQSGKHAQRLKSRDEGQTINLTMADKLIGKIRKERKDIFVVGFKTTTGASSDEQYITALNMLKENSINLVLANDTVTRNNMIVAPEETRYCETKNRETVLDFLVKMVNARSHNTFTRSTVVEGDSVQWDSEMVPDNLRKVVDHLVERGAYRVVRNATAGHFAVKIDDHTILTSKRKQDFNRLSEIGLVKVEYEGLDKVIAYGAKPSVGGQSQRIIFDEHRDLDCIVHAHVKLRKDARDRVNIASQWQNECGSFSCGQNTSRNLCEHEYGIHAVMLDNHGPNIVFSRNTPADKVIDFIEANFDLESKTGGLVTV